MKIFKCKAQKSKKKRKIKHGKCVKQVGFWTPIRFLAEAMLQKEEFQITVETIEPSLESLNSREIYWEREKIVSQKHVLLFLGC